MNFDDKTDAEIAELMEQLKAELIDRKDKEAVDREVAEIVARYRSNKGDEGPEPGAEFVQPKRTADSYLKSEIVTFGGQEFESAISCNTCAPTGECAHAAWKKI